MNQSSNISCLVDLLSCRLYVRSFGVHLPKGYLTKFCTHSFPNREILGAETRRKERIWGLSRSGKNNIKINVTEIVSKVIEFSCHQDDSSLGGLP